MVLRKEQLKTFLDEKKLGQYLEKSIQNLPTASFLFVTYNRCPHKEFESNPLTWAIKSLCNGKSNPISDILIVDDYSSDYTKENVDWLRADTEINIQYIRLSEKKECSSARRIGIEQVENDLVFMGDDDCLYSNFFAAASVLTYQFLKKKHPQEKIAVLNLPVYEKMFWPIETVPRALIGKVQLEQTFFYHEFGKFIEEYLENPEYMGETGLLFPLKVDTFAGVNLCDRKLIEAAGNYLDLSMWPYGYSEHIELSYKLLQMGYSIYHQPDPRAGCLHLKYGGKSRDHFLWPSPDVRLEGFKYSLGEMIKMAQVPLVKTGARASEEIFHLVEIGSFFSFYLKISPELALRFAEKEYDVFVKENKVFSTTPEIKIPSRNARHNLFVEALQIGLKASRQQTGKSYLSVEQKLRSLFNF